MPTPSNLSEQTLAVPNGAGAVQSAGETFQVRPYTGTGSYVIRIETQPGHAGLSQSLALTYSTHGGNDIAGLGWSLGLTAVQRRTDKGLPAFADNLDTFALQGDELLPTGGGSYRLRIERRFARIRHVIEAGRDFWVVTERDGNRAFYGLEPDHRLHDGAGRIAAWHVSKRQDANGNEVSFSYRRDATTRDVRLTSIEWAGCYRVQFSYALRPDPIESFRAGFKHSQQHRLSRIDVEVRRTSTGNYHTHKVYALTYRTSTITGRSLLSRVAITGIHPDGSTHELPAVNLGYTVPNMKDQRWHDLKGGLPGASLQDRNLTLARQSGSGLPDILETTSTGHWLRSNLGGGTFGTARRVTSPAHVLLEHPGAFISDMNGDGWGDLVVNGGRHVYRGGNTGGGWGLPYTSAHLPSVDLEAPGVRVADLNADGIPDALRAGVGSWAYFENLGEGVWAPGRPVLNPPPVQLDDPRVHLTDINGDGIPDLVFMDRNRILVWPGEGFGRFGSSYQLKHAPDFGNVFDPAAVRWADLTGSGHADLLYVTRARVVICLNHAGTALSDPVMLATAPQSSHGHVEPVDLLGSGAAGLLFTDHQSKAGAWRYLELFAGGRPDLLTTVDGGLGATTTITYSSSARDWLADNRAGQPCRTTMPSPELVVAGITTHDRVTGNRLGVSYRYHHGVYDGAEREFRGFAMVEQIEREADADDPQPLPPVLVKRWYHTGFDVDLRDEYAPLPEQAISDEVPKLPWAFRSLRGLLKREETFGLDGQSKPYVVQEIGYRVFPIQNTPGTQNYSFAPLATMSRIAHLERSNERRVVETATRYDRHSGGGYGLPVEVREKAYGRRGVFSTPHEIAQTKDLERFTITGYIHRDQPDGSYWAPYTPSYLVGKPALVERFGRSDSTDVLLARERYFYDGEPYQGLGYPGTSTEIAVTRGLLSCKLAWALTDDLWASVYPPDSGARTRFDAYGGYLADGADHYAHVERYRYDNHGMVIGTKDPKGNESLFEHDGAYGLFPIRSIDAAGHPARLTRGELPFQVEAVVDANGNTTGFTYDPTGLPRSKSVQGKYDGNDWTGDPPSHPTEVYAYDLSATPTRIRIQTRQIRLGATLDIVRYVDGLGRTVQERHTAEPDVETGTNRFRVTGWQVFNHKGLIVKLYQPFFAGTDEYGEGETASSVVETRYDPLGRAIRVEHPDGTFETTTYHPWARIFSDRNDNSGHITSADPRYGRFAADLKKHAGTSAQTFTDALGRIIATAEDNAGEVHVTRKTLDLKDQVIELWDARGLSEATWVFSYDKLGHPVHIQHRTALGERYTLADAAGNPIWSRDARGIEVIRAFDVLNRPLEEMSSDGADLKLRRQWRYGTYDEHSADFASHQFKNLFGQVEEERDSDGLRFFEYDFRGLVTKISHRFWAQNDANGKAWDNPESQLWTEGASWDPPILNAARDGISYLHLPDLGDATTLAIDTTYDAAGRASEIAYPGGMRTRKTYNGAGLLSEVELDRGAGAGYQRVAEVLAYNARRQPIYLRHANGVETTYEYDGDLERLARIFTRLVDSSTTHFQDLAYAYDPMGNPMEITDNLTNSSFSHNQIIPNTRTFEYDPRYRLIKATGKKHRSVRRKDTGVLVTSPDPNDYQPYTIRYAYDAVGNFTRNQEYDSKSLHYKRERLDLFNGDESEAGTFDDPSLGNFRYDASGNTTHTPRHQELTYTHDNQVRYVNLNGGGHVRYFRHGDQRVLRFVKKNGVMALTVYLGSFEYRLRKTATDSTKLVLHVAGHGRHAQAERVLAGADPDSLELFFHHSDHLGSGHVLTTEEGELLSQEENFPYGGVSDRRDVRNRYRFIGVEQDEDTHLCMTGPRTYDPVSGRFLQGDPIAESRFELSPYLYSSAAPLRRLDPGGYSDDNTFDPDAPDPAAPKVKPTEPKPVVPLGDFTMNEKDIKWWKTRERPIFSAALTAEMDVKGGWTGLAGDPIWFAETNGAESAGDYLHAQKVRQYGELIGDNDLIKAADSVIEDVELATEIRMAAAEGGNAAAKAGLKSAADAGLDMAKMSFKRGIPFVGLFFIPGSVADANQAFEQGDYVTAGLKYASIGYDPVDWGYAAAGLRIYATETWKTFQAEQTSRSIQNEIMRLQAEEFGEPWPPPVAPVYDGPCPSCHY